MNNWLERIEAENRRLERLQELLDETERDTRLQMSFFLMALLGLGIGPWVVFRLEWAGAVILAATGLAHTAYYLWLERRSRRRLAELRDE